MELLFTSIPITSINVTTVSIVVPFGIGTAHQCERRHQHEQQCAPPPRHGRTSQVKSLECQALKSQNLNHGQDSQALKACAIQLTFSCSTSSLRESSQVYSSIHKQQTTIRKPIECAPEASSGGREWAEMTGVLFQLLT